MMMSESYRSVYRSGALEVGIDEAGRGPLIGRVYAGACVWPEGVVIPEVRDSKKYHKREDRERAYDLVKSTCISWGVGYSEPWEIDQIGINNATFEAMRRAMEDTGILPQIALVDGSVAPGLPVDHSMEIVTVVGGDGIYQSIAGASVIAKCEHDRYIDQILEEYPQLDCYGLSKNMGYGTKAHLDAIETHGISNIHRASFGRCKGIPVRIFVGNEC